MLNQNKISSTDKFFSNGVTINYFDNKSESSSCLFFIHGNSHSYRTFRYQITAQELSEYRVIAIDLPGHGDSDWSSSYSFEQMKNICIDLIEFLSLENVLIVGHSLGGHIAIEMLNSYRPVGVLIFGTPPLKLPYDPRGFQQNEFVAELFSLEKKVDLRNFLQHMYCNYEVTDEDCTEYRKVDPSFRESIPSWIEQEMFSHELDLLKSYSGHKCIVQGKADKFIDANYFLDNFTAEEVEGIYTEIAGPHNIHVECSNLFTQILFEFSKKVFNPNVSLVKSPYRSDRIHV